MVTKVVYVACDGKEFNTEKDCLAYESSKIKITADIAGFSSYTSEKEKFPILLNKIKYELKKILEDGKIKPINNEFQLLSISEVFNTVAPGYSSIHGEDYPNSILKKGYYSAFSSTHEHLIECLLKYKYRGEFTCGTGDKIPLEIGDTVLVKFPFEPVNCTPIGPVITEVLVFDDPVDEKEE